MKRVIGLVLAATLLCAVPAMASELKLGYVDMQQALNTCAAGVAAKQNIAAQVKKYKSTIESRKKALDKLRSELQKQSAVLSDDARTAKEQEFQEKAKDLQRFTKDVQDELQQKDADFTHKILGQLFKLVQEIGKKDGYTMILEKSQGAVLYASGKVDLTSEVVKEYDAMYNKSGAKAK
jgi:outer membrane protein